ncbi:MAG TPA: VOC family protein [Bacteroidales bacterium]|nr:VOC family protein [Bacteroidales bacterium]
MKNRNPVVHFELPAEDKKRMADFYSEAFSWEPHFLGEEMGNYVTVSTAETDKDGMIQQKGAINGGFYMKNPDSPVNGTNLVIAVEDINEHMNIIRNAGGEVLGEPVNIPGVGALVYFRDTEGNTCSILQPIMPMNNNAGNNRI